MLQRTTNLLDGVKDVHVSRTMFVRSILPIGLLFSGSLILSNTAYLYLSIAYIQMLKVRSALHTNTYIINAFLSFIFIHFDVAELVIGFYASRDPSHLVGKSDQGTQSDAGLDRVHDFIGCCPCLSWRTSL